MFKIKIAVGLILNSLSSEQLEELLEKYRYQMWASLKTIKFLAVCTVTEKIKLSPWLTVTSRFGQHSFGQEGLWIQMEAEQTLNRRIIH